MARILTATLAAAAAISGRAAETTPDVGAPLTRANPLSDLSGLGILSAASTLQEPQSQFLASRLDTNHLRGFDSFPAAGAARALQDPGVACFPPFAPGDTSFNALLGKLAWRESSNDMTAVNPLNFAGCWQSGKALLSDTGYYNIAAGENSAVNDYSQGTWTGKNGVHSLNDFLHNRAAQIDVVTLELKQYALQVQMFGDGAYVGRNINGTEVTYSGLVVGYHLQGNNLQRWLAGADVRDELGTPVTEYVNMFGGFSFPADFAAQRQVSIYGPGRNAAGIYDPYMVPYNIAVGANFTSGQIPEFVTPEFAAAVTAQIRSGIDNTIMPSFRRNDAAAPIDKGILISDAGNGLRGLLVAGEGFTPDYDFMKQVGALSTAKLLAAQPIPGVTQTASPSHGPTPASTGVGLGTIGKYAGIALATIFGLVAAGLGIATLASRIRGSAAAEATGAASGHSATAAAGDQATPPDASLPDSPGASAFRDVGTRAVVPAEVVVHGGAPVGAEDVAVVVTDPAVGADKPAGSAPYSASAASTAISGSAGGSPSAPPVETKAVAPASNGEAYRVVAGLAGASRSRSTSSSSDSSRASSPELDPTADHAEEPTATGSAKAAVSTPAAPAQATPPTSAGSRLAAVRARRAAASSGSPRYALPMSAEATAAFSGGTSVVGGTPRLPTSVMSTPPGATRGIRASTGASALAPDEAGSSPDVRLASSPAGNSAASTLAAGPQGRVNTSASGVRSRGTAGSGTPGVNEG